MNLSDTPTVLVLFLTALVSLYGYGAILVRTVFPQWASYPGLAMLLGLVLFLGTSGYIELFRLGSSHAFWVLILLGVGLALLPQFSNQSQQKRVVVFFFKIKSLGFKKTVAIVFAILFTLAYCINMLFHDFNRGDDYSSYLIFPMRILAEGF